MPKAEDSYEVKCILKPWELKALEERVSLCRKSRRGGAVPERAQVIRVAILDYLRSRTADLDLDEKEAKHRTALMMSRGIR